MNGNSLWSAFDNERAVVIFQDTFGTWTVRGVHVYDLCFFVNDACASYK